MMLYGHYLDIITQIEHDPDCIVSRLQQPIKLDFPLPDDLKYYLEHYSAIRFFPATDYSIRIVGLPGFQRANPVIVGEEAPDDVSHYWYIIAEDGNTQYITIDIGVDRQGRCYDSFWDRHGLPGEQVVVAKSFTELLERLYAARGGRWFWLEDSFENYGDAYDQ
ncbi:SMI1/KNR4 family protein [Chitinophaga silvisoli]|nr:SMI1/KNR4 family protein [Chitinophaga silvisoli]